MKFTTPQPLQHEHEALHEQLYQATQAGGEVSEAAKKLVHLMHPHFAKEDQIALPPLGLLAALARGEWNAEMVQVLPLTEQLEAELPQMLAEHQSIVAALNKLREVAARAGRGDIVAFAEALVEHARTEEEVMYPAAVLVGQVVRQRLGQRAAAPAQEVRA
ncbi:hemerythrin domain-containing protein [Azohydromonas lata]|uniref:Hemerythrin domain-containing protein n=1 Tax=Azohydromonas lata TaxID=45677 RepID=A0ABU5IHI1_9BURK|nr:hemerythrin domain-containing protein [Azohydromonas lata]MDZ5457955.1 hemerythrin domain-containing protein [Azohydromonas lata]